MSIDACNRTEIVEFKEEKEDDLRRRLYSIDPEFGRGANKAIHLVLPNDCSIDEHGYIVYFCVPL